MPSIYLSGGVLLLTIILFFHPRVSNAVAATVGAILMSLIGMIEFKTVFNSYTSTSIVLMVGMMIVGGGMFHTGFAGYLGNKIVGLTGKSERSLQLIAILSGWAISAVASGSASMMILYPIFCSICLASNVSMSKIMLPMFSGIGFGSFTTVAGSGMGPATSAVLVEAGYAGWSFFEPAWFGVPRALLHGALILLIGYKLLPKTHVMPDAAEVAKADALPNKLQGKMIVSGVILALTIVGMVIDSDYCPMHMCSAIGGVASVLTGCLNEKEMFKSISWSTVFLIGGMSAVGKGVEASGAGQMLADAILSVAGSDISPIFIMLIFFFSTGIITQFMSNNAAAAIMAPIAVIVAETMGVDPRGFVSACLFGSAIGMCTPMATPILAFIMEAGKYNPKDILKWGLLESATSIIIAVIVIPIIWL